MPNVAGGEGRRAVVNDNPNKPPDAPQPRPPDNSGPREPSISDKSRAIFVSTTMLATSVFGSSGIIERHDAAKAPTKAPTELAVRPESPQSRQVDTVSAPPPRVDTAKHPGTEIKDPPDDSTPGDDLNDTEVVESRHQKDLIIRPE